MIYPWNPPDPTPPKDNQNFQPDPMENQPIITHVLSEDDKIVVVYRLDVPDEYISPIMAVQVEEGAEPQEWISTKRERISDHAEIPDGHYVTYELPENE